MTRQERAEAAHWMGAHDFDRECPVCMWPSDPDDVNESEDE